MAKGILIGQKKYCRTASGTKVGGYTVTVHEHLDGNSCTVPACRYL